MGGYSKFFLEKNKWGHCLLAFRLKTILPSISIINRGTIHICKKIFLHTDLCTYAYFLILLPDNQLKAFQNVLPFQKIKDSNQLQWTPQLKHSSAVTNHQYTYLFSHCCPFSPHVVLPLLSSQAQSLLTNSIPQRNLVQLETEQIPMTRQKFFSSDLSFPSVLA